ncbi:TonB-dependent receptor protein [Lysobacter dokdonensis DS-58]|uniref:TonB-dependent receptor protein n=1 Tax=Lysobacter dokdonensis DS-58 TaxID=1300345 RepID=A0A0A2X4V8_9GAMM|nr:TonB-dependent receptor [Lysobacter dokdonensis]KGQ20269.1 TonB-dependent receptor protein [Lysobacter dokdonensis DS-58]
MSSPYSARCAAPCRVAFASTLLLACAPSHAGEPVVPQRTPEQLDTVTVLGARPIRTVDDLANARRKANERTGGTAVIDGDSYRDRRAGTLVDALGFAPGVFVQPRFGADESRVSIRGSGLQRTFHGRGLVVLQDGTPINLADGAFDMQAIEPLASRYITVYRGANALEYGAATLGGAIDFVSPTGYDAPSFTGRVEGGSFDFRRGQVAAAGVSGRADGYATLTGTSQDGYRDHAVQETYRFFGNAGYRFNETLDGRLYFTKVDSRSQLPGNLTFAEFARDPSLAAPANVSMDQRRDFVLERLAGRLAWSPTAGDQVALSLSVSDKQLHHPIFQVLEQDSRDVGVDLRWRHESEWGGHAATLIAGVRTTNGSLHDERFVNVGGNPGAPTNIFDQHARDSIAYLEQQVALDDRWTVALGAQGLHAVRRSDDKWITGGRDESFDKTYSGVSPKLGVRAKMGEHAQVFANVSRSLEPPTFGELTGGPGVTQVDMQTATTVEVGTRVQHDKGWLDVALYHARVDDELLALNDANGNPLGTTNADRTVHQGIELGGAWDWTSRWRTSLQYLFNDFRFDGDPRYGDNALAGVPRQQVRAELRWSPVAAFHVVPGVEWNDKTWIDHANSLRAKGATVWNLRIGGDLGARWTWFADMRNVFDKRWIASTNVVADARGVDGRHLFPGDGRGLYAGVELRL